MPREFRWANAYTGGGVGTLDKIDGAYLEDLEAAIVVTGSMATFHSLDDDLSGAESAPSIINPDTNAGTKSWSLVGLTLPNTGLHILDTDASHDLIIKPGSDLSADRELTLTTGDAARTITLSGNPTLSDWFDQGVKAASTPAFAGLSLTGNLALAANSITGTSVDISNAELQQLSLIGATTISGTQWGYLGSSTVAGGAMMDAADAAAQMALLSGNAGAAFDFNSQNLTSVGTIGCGSITTTGDYLLANGNYVGISAAERLEFYTAGYAAFMGCKVGVGIASPSYDLHLYNSQNGTTYACVNNPNTGVSARAGFLFLVDGGYGYFYACGENFNDPSDWANSFVFGVPSSMTSGLVLYSSDKVRIQQAAGTDIFLVTGNNVDIVSHNAATIGLKLGGTLVTSSAAELNALDGISANGTSLIQAADYAAMMALLSGTPTATFDWNDQQISNIKSIAFNDGGATCTQVKDEDDMVSNSATMLATQQSIKAYVDAGGGVTDHGALTGLADDDHTQYLLADGTRALAGRWDMFADVATDQWDDDDSNTFFGIGICGAGNMSGADYSVGIGYQALYSLTSGDANFCLGYKAGYAITTGVTNFCAGYEAGKAITTGMQNVFMGYQAGLAIIDTHYNIAIGANSLKTEATGEHNLAIGSFACGLQNGGTLNLGIGTNASYYNVTGDYNIAIGASAGYGASGQSHSYDLFIGYKAGEKITTGASNIGIGGFAGQALTSAGTNVFIGYATAYRNTTGADNTAIGAWALSANVTGSNNTYIGRDAGKGATGQSHSNNTFIGYKAGRVITTGGNNICVGYQAGDLLTTGTDNIIIGYDIDSSAAGATYELNIGGAIFGDLTAAKKRIGVNVAVASIAAQFHVDQAVADEAIPVLALDQADISEGFINFIGSDRGIITGATDSLESVRVEINGVVRRIAVYVDA